MKPSKFTVKYESCSGEVYVETVSAYSRNNVIHYLKHCVKEIYWIKPAKETA